MSDKRYSFWDIDDEVEDVPYAGCYTGDYMNHLGMLFEYADNEGYDVQEIFTGLIKSDFKRYLDMCHPHYIGGCSNFEFANYVLCDTLGLKLENYKSAYPGTDANWWGWSMALVQWWFNISWEDMEKYCKIEIAKRIYPAGHTTDNLHILEAYRIRLKEADYPKELGDPWERNEYFLQKYGK